MQNIIVHCPTNKWVKSLDSKVKNLRYLCTTSWCPVGEVPTQQESGGSSVGGNWFQREGSARVLFSNEEMIVAVCRVFYLLFTCLLRCVKGSHTTRSQPNYFFNALTNSSRESSLLGFQTVEGRMTLAEVYIEGGEYRKIAWSFVVTGFCATSAVFF